MADENHRATSAPPVYSTTEGLSSILSHCIQSHPWLYEQTNLWKRVHHCDYYAFAVAEIRHCQDNRIDYLTLVFRSLKTSWAFSVASSVEGSFWSYLDTDFSTLRFFPDTASNRENQEVRPLADLMKTQGRCSAKTWGFLLRASYNENLHKCQHCDPHFLRALVNFLCPTISRYLIFSSMV